MEKALSDSFKEDQRDIPNVNHNYPNNCNYLPDHLKVINPSQLLYSYNEYGEPIIIFADNATLANDHSKPLYPLINASQYPNRNDNYKSLESLVHSPNVPSSSSKHRNLYPSNQVCASSFSYLGLAECRLENEEVHRFGFHL